MIQKGFQATEINRRGVVASLGLTALLTSGIVNSARAATAAETLDSTIRDFQSSEELSAPNYEFREFANDFPDLKRERAPSKLQPSSLSISPIALSAIVAFEVSSKTVYERKHYDRPTYPGGSSGVTIGIGYDLGYVSPELFVADWGDLIADKDVLRRLSGTCTQTGKAAEEFIPELQDIQVNWDIAQREFGREIKKYVALTLSQLPNFAALSENRRGALVSLVYNRGPSFDVPAKGPQPDRYAEMRNIKSHMIQKDFDAIPDEIQQMARLWPGVKGLVERRNAEAALFKLD